MADIETQGTAAVERLIARTDYLVSHINEKDKEPSWDGFIYAYKHSGDNHEKKDLAGRAPVQIKGHKCDEIDNEPKSFSVDVSDLKNYLQDGGVIFFVVFITDKDEFVYYDCLLPYDLKKILKKHGEQKTFSIHLREFPTGKKEITDLVLNFIRDCNKQKAAINAEPVTIDDLAKNGELNTVSFGFTTVDQERYKLAETPMNYFFDHDMYLYADLKHGISLPVEHFEGITVVEKEIRKTVSVKGKEFYSSYRITYRKVSTEIWFGNSLQMIPNEQNKSCKINFKAKGKLSERIADVSFILSALRAGGVELNGAFLPIFNCSEDELASFDLPGKEEYLTYLRQCQSVFDELHVKKDLDCDAMKQADIFNLQRLVSAIAEKNLVPLKDTGQPIGRYRVGNIEILVMALKDKDSGLFRLYDLFKAPVEVRSVDNDKKEHPSTACVYLKKDDLLHFDNIDCNTILSLVTKVPLSSCYESQLILFMLEVLKAYDELKLPAHPFLKLAAEINDFIIGHSAEGYKDINVLNRLQIKKRSQELELDDIRQLYKIVAKAEKKGEENILTGAYILLGYQEEALSHFKRMTEEEQKAFREYPICRFANWEKAETNETAKQ